LNQHRSSVFIKKHVDESVRLVDDLDHQLFHLLIIEPRHAGPGNHAERTGDGNIGIIASCRRWSNPSMEILQPRVPKALQNEAFGETLLEDSTSNVRS
jgi:hypothetical protein